MKIVQFCSPISQLIITVGITQNQAKTHFQTKDQIKTKLTKQQKKTSMQESQICLQATQEETT